MFKSFKSQSWLVLLLMALFVSAAGAADRPNILIMGEDYDEDTVPRNSVVFTRVLNTLSNQMHDAGFDVFDETAITLDNFAQGRVRRTDAEMIDIARSIRRPPIDIVVMFSIYASAHEKSYTTKVKSRVQGRLINVQTGQRLGNFELAYPGGWNAPVNCSRDCLLDTVGSKSKIIANDVGAVLVKKLSWMVDKQAHVVEQPGIMAYNLVFDGFTKDDMFDIEEYLMIFSGYESHRVVYSGATRTEYWYKSDIGTAKLNRNLHKMMDRLGKQYIVQGTGNTYTVKKVSLRSKKPQASPSEW